MRKILCMFLVLFAIWATDTAEAQNRQRYVRKKVQPNFFIPSSALSENKPEKVYIPKYRVGETTAKRISPSENKEKPKIVKSIPKNTNKQNAKASEELISSDIEKDSYTPPAEATYANDEKTPEYQKMYQNYLKDLQSIAKTGNVSDPGVLNDLKVMNSDKRIEIDKNFNKQRNIKRDLDEALKN